MQFFVGNVCQFYYTMQCDTTFKFPFDLLLSQITKIAIQGVRVSAVVGRDFSASLVAQVMSVLSS